MENYIELAQRTSATAIDAPTLHDRTERCANPAKLRALKSLLGQIATHCKLLDTIKRDLFYGKDLMNVESFSESDSHSADVIKANAPMSVKLMHGMIGILTEAGETAEALLAILAGQGIDMENIVEEMGDSLYYIAEIAAALGFDSLTPFQRRNIAKLQARYPDGYSDIKAIERDLAAERRVLEQKD